MNQKNGPPKKGETPKGLTKVEGLPHPAPTVTNSTGSRRLPQEAHADLGITDDGSAVGS